MSEILCATVNSLVIDSQPTACDGMLPVYELQKWGRVSVAERPPTPYSCPWAIEPRLNKVSSQKQEYDYEAGISRC